MAAEDTPPSGPFSGVRVLDLTRVVMGPLATQVLADQGADVILVEAPGGDTNRVMGPGPHPELSGIALNLLRNKRSVDIDLKSDEGRRDLAELVPHLRRRGRRRCDRRCCAASGLDYDSLSAAAPGHRLLPGPGLPAGSSDRPNEPAYDDIIQAATGVADIVERVTGDARRCCRRSSPTRCAASSWRRPSPPPSSTASAPARASTSRCPMQQAMTAFMLVEHGAARSPSRR